MGNNITSLGVFLLGGLGTRLRSIVSDIPKPMAPINDKPFLELLLKYWISEGVDQFIFLVGYKSEKIQSYFGNKFENKDIIYLKENKLLGTGGALLNCQRQLKLKKPFLLVNGDTFFKVSNKDLTDFYQKNHADWCLSLFKTKVEDRYLKIDINKKNTINFINGSLKSSWANGGVYIINPFALDPHLKTKNFSSLEKDILIKSQLLNQRIYGYKTDGFFIDIGIPEDYKEAQVINFMEI